MLAADLAPGSGRDPVPRERAEYDRIPPSFTYAHYIHYTNTHTMCLHIHTYIHKYTQAYTHIQDPPSAASGDVFPTCISTRNVPLL